MVTYCFYAVFAALGSFNLYHGRPWVALFYAVILAIMVWFDRKMARDQKWHEAEMAKSAAKHKELLAKMDARRAEDQKRFDAEVAEILEKRRQFMAENYIVAIVIRREDFLPLTEDREASLRAEFDEAASQCLHNLRG